MNLRILIAYHHEVVRIGLATILRDREDCQIVGQASEGREAVQVARRAKPDVVILSAALPQLNGIEAARQILEFAPRTRAIIVSAHCDQHSVTEALRAGARGYLLSHCTADEVQIALQKVAAGATYLSEGADKVVVAGFLGESIADGVTAFTTLTPKQREVLQLLAEGNTNKEVAAHMSVSEKTVEAHRAQIVERLQIRSVASLTKYAIREGLTSAEA